MVLVFGMAGLAEAEESFELMIGYGGLLLLALAAAVGLFVRSQVASGIALALAFVLTVMFRPWEAFRSFESGDSDVHYWVAAWRTFAWWWGFAVAAALAASARAFCFPGKAAVQGKQSVEATAAPDQGRHPGS